MSCLDSFFGEQTRDQGGIFPIIDYFIFPIVFSCFFFEEDCFKRLSADSFVNYLERLFYETIFV